MSLARHAKSRDLNEPPIVDALEAVGATVERADKPVDLVVGFRGQTYLFEVKAPLGKQGGASGSPLTEDQQKLFNRWRGGMLAVVRTPGDALRLIGAVSDSGVEIGPRVDP